MIKIFIVFIIVFLGTSNSCQTRFDKDSYYKSYEESAILTISEFICQYYKEKYQTPDSKANFENFLSKQETDFGLLKILNSLNYKFIINEYSNELIMYDLGMDGVDDSLKFKYTLEDLSVNKYIKGDILIISTRLEQCKRNMREEKNSLYIYSKGEMLYDENRKILREINSIISSYVNNNVINDSINLNKYFPKPDAVRKLSVLHSKLENDKWTINIEYEEHAKIELQNLIPLIKDWLEASDLIKTQRVDELFIPISYYDKSQLEFSE